MKKATTLLAGAAAGVINGLLGAGGGMVLVPLLGASGELHENEIFPASVAIMLPLCVVSLFVGAQHAPIAWAQALPYLLGGALGSLPAGVFGKKIPVAWLHRALGIVILWGGVRYLWL